MTIREHLRRKQRTATILSVLCIVVVILVLPYLWLTKNVYVAVPFVCTIIFACFIPARLLRCPKCSGNLGRFIGITEKRLGMYYCPFCGVNLDDQLEDQPAGTLISALKQAGLKK
jgi:hypothetical protein